MKENQLDQEFDQSYEIVEYIDSDNNSKGCLYGFLGVGGCLVIVIAALAVPVVLGITTFNTTVDRVTALLWPPGSEAHIVSSDTIIKGVRPLGQLVSIRSQMAKADVDIQVSQSALNACGHSAKYVTQGTVEAGVDLTQFDTDDFSYNMVTNTYTISLPAPELTNCRIDFIRQYANSFTACNVDFDLTRLLAQHTTITSFARESIEAGILDRAAHQASLLLTNFVKGLTGSDVVVHFTPSDLSLPDPSCHPDPPTGWVYYLNENVWRQEN